jgi:hypothetical protein
VLYVCMLLRLGFSILVSHPTRLRIKSEAESVIVKVEDIELLPCGGLDLHSAKGPSALRSPGHASKLVSQEQLWQNRWEGAESCLDALRIRYQNRSRSCSALCLCLFFSGVSDGVLWDVVGEIW